MRTGTSVTLPSSILSLGLRVADASLVSPSEVLFYVFAAIALISAIATISRRNPVVAAVWLVACFCAVAACYVLLSATFLAAIQVLVYAGAMMVLFVFVIMVLDVDETGRAEHRSPSPVGPVSYLSAIVFGTAILAWVLAGTLSRQYAQPPKALPAGSEFGTAEALGRLLFGEYLFAFEAISLLLFAAVVGAVVVARSRREREKEAVLAGMDDAARRAAGLAEFGAPSATGHRGGN